MLEKLEEGVIFREISGFGSREENSPLKVWNESISYKNVLDKVPRNDLVSFQKPCTVLWKGSILFLRLKGTRNVEIVCLQNREFHPSPYIFHLNMDVSHTMEPTQSFQLLSCDVLCHETHALCVFVITLIAACRETKNWKLQKRKLYGHGTSQRTSNEKNFYFPQSMIRSHHNWCNSCSKQ